jgi:hypothetical protein
MKFGIENLKKVFALVIEMGNVADKIGQENSKAWRKWFTVIELVDEIGALLTVDWKMLKPEYMDLSDGEKQEIRQFLKEKFDIKNDKLEMVIEDSFIIAQEIEVMVKKLIALVREMRQD